MDYNIDMLCEEILKKCNEPKSLKEILVKFEEFNKKDVKRAFNLLVEQSKLMPAKSKKVKKYANFTYFGLCEGKFQSSDKGYGFVTPAIALESGRDIFIPEKFTKTAWNNDIVLVKLIKSRFKKDKKGKRQEGEVVKVIKRSAEEILGRVFVKNGNYFLEPTKKRYPVISIDDENLKNATENDMVSLKVRYFGNHEFMPQGEVKQVFGKAETKESSIKSILYSNGISEKFPPMVDLQVKGVSMEITNDVFEGRLDLTDKMIFTIDGDYSKDFDDAVSLEELPNGNVVLGVHIADVSHYVTEGSPLDLEAYERGTSVYFANKVVPMLPFELSNGICSLNPDENRFAFSVFMEIDSKAHVVKSKFHKSVIKSKYRMTYNNVNKILDEDAEMCEKYSEIKDIIVKMNALADKLGYKRQMAGYLDLNIPECYIITDENDVPTDVKLRGRGKSEKLIEQFMVLTNEVVAKFMDDNEIPSVYRVHESPNMDKLKVFASTAKLFGFKIQTAELSDPLALQRVLNESEDTPHHKMLATMLLRSLSRAKYLDENIGHSGLALDHYLHFTSPIRRYPDLIVHRMLARKLEHKKFYSEDIEFVEEAAAQSTTRENAADNASRDIEKLYLAEYMSKFIGEEFDVYVSGVQNYGIFVELENTIEGLIRTESMNDDDYDYDEEKIRLVGRTTKKIYTIGTKLRAKLINASQLNGQIDFVVVEEE